jgi:F1F0 ATPase subunit 2
MTAVDPLSNGIALVSAMTLAGAVLGLAYFRGLRLVVDLFAQGRGRMLLLGVTLARFAGLVGAFLLVVQFGTAALLACFLGFLLARAIALRSAAEVR